MERVIVALLVLAIIAPTLLSISERSVARADLNSAYELVVMPFFTQKNIVGPNGYQAIRLVAYGRMEAFIDLNHNGQLDPGEPFFNETAPGKIIIYEVRADFGAEPYKGYVGDAWIFTKYSLMAEFIAYSHDLGVIAEYNIPPTGNHFLIPPVPGVVYISPASSLPVKVSLNASGITRTFILKPGDYAAVPNNGSAIEVESNESITVVLGNPVQGPGAFLTEIPPFNDDYLASYTPIPFPKFLLDSKTGPYNVTSYVYIVGADGEIGVLRYGHPALISDLLEQIGSKASKGYAVVLLQHRLSSGGTAIAAVPVYRFQRLSLSLTNTVSGSEWLTLQGVRNDTYINGSINIVNGVPTALDTWPAVFIDLDNDWNADLLFRPYLSPVVDHSIFTLGVSNTYPFLYYQTTYWDLRYISYNLEINPDGRTMSAAYNAIPVPKPMVQDYRSIVDLRTGKYPFLIHKFYKNGAITPGFTSASSIVNPNGESARIVYKHNVDSTIPCSSIHYYAALITDTLKPVAWNSTTGCKITLRYTTMKPKRVYYAIPIPYVDGIAILDKAEEIYVHVNTPRNTPGIPQPYTVAEAGMKIAGCAVGEGVTETSLQIIPIIKPPSNVTTMFKFLQLTTPPPQQPSQPPTTTSTIPPSTTTKRTQQTTSYERTGTANPTVTKQPSTSSAQSQLSQPISMSTGDILEYKVKLSAKGPKGSVTSTGILTLEARVVENEVGFITVKNTVKGRELGPIVSPVSDLFIGLSTATGPRYYLPGYEPLASSKCPMLAPGMDSKSIEGSLRVLYYTIEYNCKYSNGVLVYVKARAHGEVQGQAFTVNIEASLFNTTIRGVEAVTGTGSSSSQHLLLAVIAAVSMLVIGFIALFFIRRR